MMIMICLFNWKSIILRSWIMMRMVSFCSHLPWNIWKIDRLINLINRQVRKMLIGKLLKIGKSGITFIQNYWTSCPHGNKIVLKLETKSWETSSIATLHQWKLKEFKIMLLTRSTFTQWIMKKIILKLHDWFICYTLMDKIIYIIEIMCFINKLYMLNTLYIYLLINVYF